MAAPEDAPHPYLTPRNPASERPPCAAGPGSLCYRRYPTHWGQALAIARITVRMKTLMRHMEHPAAPLGPRLPAAGRPGGMTRAPRAAVYAGGPPGAGARRIAEGRRLVYGVYFAGARAGDELTAAVQDGRLRAATIAHPERFQYVLPFGLPFDGSLDLYSAPPRFFLNGVETEPTSHLAVVIWDRLGASYSIGYEFRRELERAETWGGGRGGADRSFNVVAVCGFSDPVVDVHSSGIARGLCASSPGRPRAPGGTVVRSLAPVADRHARTVARAVVEFACRPGRALSRRAAASFAAAAGAQN